MFDNFDKEKKEENKNKQDSYKPNLFSIYSLSDKQIKKITDGNHKRIAPPHPSLSDFNKRIKKLEEKGRRRGKRNMYIGIIGGALIAITVMCLIYFWTQEIYKMSNKTEEDMLKVQNFELRK